MRFKSGVNLIPQVAFCDLLFGRNHPRLSSTRELNLDRANMDMFYEVRKQSIELSKSANYRAHAYEGTCIVAVETLIR